MRYLLLAFLLSCVSELKAANYYFSSSIGDDARSMSDAQRAVTPWKSIIKLNQIISLLAPGDSVLFKRDDVFQGNIVITRSGNAGQPIVFAAYGSGKNPVITGLSTVTNWQSVGGNIYEATVAAPSMINMLLIDQQLKPIGRYPNINTVNKGWLTIESFSGIPKLPTMNFPVLPIGQVQRQSSGRTGG